MRVIQPSLRLQKLLTRFEGVGGFVSHFLIALDGAGNDYYESHRRAAVLMLEAIRDTNGGDLGCDEEMTIDESKMFGRMIELEEFVGGHFDWKKRRLLHRRRPTRSTGIFWWENDPDIPENVLPEESVLLGYAYAFSDPSYPLSIPPKKVDELFLQLTDELFGGFCGSFAIFEWSTNWSNYFDPGNAILGSFCWTMHRISEPIIVGVAASLSD